MIPDNSNVPPGVLVFKYSITDIVYLRVDDEPSRGMITGITIRPGAIIYHVCWGIDPETQHFEFELTSEYIPDFGHGNDDGDSPVEAN